MTIRKRIAYFTVCILCVEWDVKDVKPYSLTRVPVTTTGINCHTVLSAQVFTCRCQCTANDYNDDNDGDVPRDRHTTSGDVTRAPVA